VSTHGKPNKVLVSHRRLSSHFTVSGSKAVSQSFYLNIDQNEVVQGQLSISPIKLCKQILNEGWCEPVTSLLKRLREFVLINGSCPVFIQAFEVGLPLLDSLEQHPEFIDVNCPSTVAVVQFDHSFTSLFTEHCTIAICQSLFQFIRINLS